VSHAGATLTIPTEDRRVLTVSVSGPESGFPVILLHGTPGSRTGPRPRPMVLHRKRVRLICYDRPGYGGSTRHPDRTVADAAGDVQRIADHLQLGRFSVVGRSGGAPHALACAAKLPQDRLHRSAALVSIAPNAPDLDWYQGMVSDNVDAYLAADRNPALSELRLACRAARTARDPHSLLAHLSEMMTAPDQRVIRDVAIRRQLTEAYGEALRGGPYGWVDDVRAFRKPWGFELDAIKGPLHLWHGVLDNFAPAHHTRWLADRIASAEMTLQANTAHFGAVEVLPAMLDWLRDTAD
jgi:pimeloyl-ACP methyl ester carboxylesterase